MASGRRKVKTLRAMSAGKEVRTTKPSDDARPKVRLGSKACRAPPGRQEERFALPMENLYIIAKWPATGRNLRQNARLQEEGDQLNTRKLNVRVEFERCRNFNRFQKEGALGERLGRFGCAGKEKGHLSHNWPHLKRRAVERAKRDS